MNFIFISPQFPPIYWYFCDRLKKNGVNVLGIGVKSARLIVASRRFSKIGFYQLKKIGVVMKKAQYFITCCELPMRTVNELTPQGVRSLLLPKPNKKKVDERQLMLDFGE